MFFSSNDHIKILTDPIACVILNVEAMSMEIRNVRHSWPEPAGFDLSRPSGGGEFIFLYFHNAVELYFAQQWHKVPPGTLIVFEPDAAHRFISRVPLVHDWMHLGGDVAAELNALGLETNHMYAVACKEQITQYAARLESEFFARGEHWQRLVGAVLDELWITIAREVAGLALQPVLQGTAQRLRELRAEMILHPEKPWTNAMMARRVNVSESRLYPLYRRLYSISPGQDLILMRVEKAKQLLQQGADVAQTAELVGYNSVYHFIRQFRQTVGTTPGKWRRR